MYQQSFFERTLILFIKECFGSLELGIARVAGDQGSQGQGYQRIAPPRPVCVCVMSDGVCVVGGVGGAHSESLVAGELELVNTGSGCYE